MGSGQVTRILVISDTHAGHIDQLEPGVLQAIDEADILVHCGDYTQKTLLDGLRARARRFVGVYGNVDPHDIRSELEARKVLDVDGKKIGIAHPHWGGPPFGIEVRLLAEFKGVDAILFGHTHDAEKKMMDGVLVLNPGQAYASWGVPATVGVLTISDGKIEGEIRVVKEE